MLLEPGAVYPAHNHPNYAGMTLGLEGEYLMRNFQVIGDLPLTSAASSFQLHETQNQMLQPGVITSIMAPMRDNVHKLHAGASRVRGLDINALLGDDGGFGFVAIDEWSRDQTGVYTAAWE